MQAQAAAYQTARMAYDKALQAALPASQEEAQMKETLCSSTGSYVSAAHATTESIEADFWAELAQIKAESIGWIPLGEGAYLHVNDYNATDVLVVGVAQVGDAVLLVG